MATLAEVIIDVRELSFDKFQTPTLEIGPHVGKTLVITSASLLIKTGNTVNHEFLFSTFTKLSELLPALIAAGYHVSSFAQYIGSIPTTELVEMTVSLDESVGITRKIFFSDADILKQIRIYISKILGRDCKEVSAMNLEDEIASYGCPRPEHLSIWVAFKLTEKRRLYEQASYYLTQTASGNGLVNQIAGNFKGVTMNVNIGDAFSLTDTPGSDYNANENPNSVGADNVLGDAQSFWYKLQLWLRKQIEDLFGDYSLRPDTVMQGHLILDKDRNFYAFFDNYPYTISPYTRALLTRN